MNNNEIWKEHPCGLKVSNYGRVLIPKSGVHPEHITIGWENSRGYLQVRYQGKQYIVQRLVGECHVPNPEHKPEIDHINRDRKDNRVENLRWVDRSENNKNRGKYYYPKNNANSNTVIQFTKSGEIVKEWPSIHEVERALGFSSSNISACCNGKYKSAYGYVWRHKLEIVRSIKNATL